MDFNDYWQENKRFVTMVVTGFVVFFIGMSVLGSVFGDQIQAANRTITSNETELRGGLFTASDKATAEAENKDLRSAVTTLENEVRFVPREGFTIDPALGSAANQFQRALTNVREDLLQRANRANLNVDASLGMPQLSPTRDAEIERYLEALDVVDTTVRLAIAAGVERVDRIVVRLDPGLSTRAGLGNIERTRVEFDVVGTSLAVTRLLTLTQRPPEGRGLHLYELEMQQARNKDDEVRLDLVLVIPRLSRAEG